MLFCVGAFAFNAERQGRRSFRAAPATLFQRRQRETIFSAAVHIRSDFMNVLSICFVDAACFVGAAVGVS